MENSPHPSGPVCPHGSPAAKTSAQIEVISTPEIQKWMSSIEMHLNEVCSIATDGKLNSDQKMKISNLCRKIGSGTSQMAVLYQSLKKKALQTYNMVEALKEKRDLTEHIAELKHTMGIVQKF